MHTDSQWNIFVAIMTPINASVTAIRDLIKQDLLASNELAARITQLRQDTADGKPSSARSIAIMASSNKDRAREIGARIEDLVGRQDKTPTDRELLQALTARQAICDKQSMQLAELRDLEFEARGEREEAFSRPSEAHAEDLGKSQTATSAGPPGLSGASSLVDLRYAAKDHEDMGKAQDNHPDPQGEIGEEHASEKDPSEHQVDHTASWPLLYRILGVDPSTENDRFRPVCDQ